MTDAQILEIAKSKIGEISPEKLQHEFIQVPVDWTQNLTVYWAVVTFKKSIIDGRVAWVETNTFKSI